jgi:hypothetical protein
MHTYSALLFATQCVYEFSVASSYFALMEYERQTTAFINEGCSFYAVFMRHYGDRKAMHVGWLLFMSQGAQQQTATSFLMEFAVQKGAQRPLASVHALP